MMHSPIFLNNISFCFSNKTCFENFSCQIYPGSRIAIIGRNGSGKSSLLKILNQTLKPSSGEVIFPNNLSIGYVEQTIHEFNHLSGGQRLNKKISRALAHHPDLLLLDEPTNHLDQDNRNHFMRMLSRYQGTLLIVSHDTELLQNTIDTLWHIDNYKIHEFTGSYDNYIRERKQKRLLIEKELAQLKHKKKNAHLALMKEQNRAAKSKSKGEKNIERRKWPTVVSKAKASRAECTSGKIKSMIDKKKNDLTDKLSDLKLPEIILPTFSLTSDNSANHNILSISRANIGYRENKMILNNINLTLTGKERVTISGKNASGKSTLLKAILNQKQIVKTGDWFLPRPEDIGYLDQHYSNLNPNLSIIDHLLTLRPDWNEFEARRHLNHFLFRKNEEVIQRIATLSGGEKARLSLSLIAAKTPRLLILDEITNNLDLETKEHVTQVLSQYPGAIIIVSHEENFLRDIRINNMYKIIDGTIINTYFR